MSGHRAVYAAHLIQSCAELPIEFVFATTDKAVASEEYRVSVAPLAKTIDLDASYAWRARNRKEVPAQSQRQLLEAIARHQPDHLYVPWGDGITQLLAFRRLRGMLAWPPEMEAEAVFHRSSQSYPSGTLSERIKKRGSRWALLRSPFSLHHFVDVLEYDWWRAHGEGRARLLPDPVETEQTDKSTARQLLGIPTEGKYIGTVGAIAAKKGCLEILQAVAEGSVAPDVRVLLLGGHSDEVRQALKTRFVELVDQGRVISIDRYVELEELNRGLAAMDVVFVGYQDHVGIASVVLRAAAAQRPVLMGHFRWGKRVGSEFNLGWNVDFSDQRQLAKTLRTALGQIEEWEPSQAGQLLVQFHESQNFGASLTRRLRERLGVGQHANLVPWEDVRKADQSSLTASPS